MGPIGRAGMYHTLKIELKCYQNHLKRKEAALDGEDNTLRRLGWEQASVAILESILECVDEMIDKDDEVNELIRNGEVSRYDA